jgi:hypothetical protein
VKASASTYGSANTCLVGIKPVNPHTDVEDQVSEGKFILKIESKINGLESADAVSG